MENRSLIYSLSQQQKTVFLSCCLCFTHNVLVAGLNTFSWMIRLIMSMSAGCCVRDRSSLTLRLRSSVHLVLDTFLSCTLHMWAAPIYTLSLSETRWWSNMDFVLKNHWWSGTEQKVALFVDNVLVFMEEPRNHLQVWWHCWLTSGNFQAANLTYQKPCKPNPVDPWLPPQARAKIVAAAACVFTLNLRDRGTEGQKWS